MTDLPLNPPDPDILRFGLSRAVQIHSEEFRAKYPQKKLDLDLVEDENLLPPDACLALYQVYQERLQQLAGDAQAEQIWVHYYPSRTHMVLDIKDDGRGVSQQADFTAMKACIETAGGQLLVSARPDGGMTLTAKVPFER